MLKKYIDYLKDNPNKLWFKRKLFGWGWTPATWQGWLVTLLFLAFIIWTGINFGNTSTEPSLKEIDWFLTKIALAVFLLMFIAYKKGEKPSWQWGIPKKDESNQEQNKEKNQQ